MLLFLILSAEVGCISTPRKALLVRTADSISLRVDDVVRNSGAKVDKDTTAIWERSLHQDLLILNDSLLGSRPGWFIHKSKWRAYRNDYYFLVRLHLNPGLNGPALAVALNNYARDVIQIQRITARWRRHISHPLPPPAIY